MSGQVDFSKTLRQWMDSSMSRSWWSGWRHFARSTGLSMPQFSILMQVYYRGQCGISEIGERFQISSAAASQLVDKLTQNGLLARTEDQNDRRAKQLTLTDKGSKLIKAGMDERYRWIDEIGNGLSAGNRAKVVEALEILTQASQQLEEKK